MDNNYTTIKITKELMNILKNLGKKGDTYETIIRELVSKDRTIVL